MKALTLWQPWASLVALGVKTIETRSWSTKYRGPLAIHAAARPPEASNFGGELDGWTVGRLDPGAPRRMWKGAAPIIDLPLGAVIAICTLIDVVPIVGLDRVINAATDHRAPLPFVCDTDNLGGALCLATPSNYPFGESIEAQRPYGDFTPGRYAWLLDDIKPLKRPVATRGHQRLWNWDRAELQLCPSAPDGEVLHCVHWFECEPCDWCGDDAEMLPGECDCPKHNPALYDADGNDLERTS